MEKVLEYGQMTPDIEARLRKKFYPEVIMGIDHAKSNLKDYCVMIMKKDIDGPILAIDQLKEFRKITTKRIEQLVLDLEREQIEQILGIPLINNPGFTSDLANWKNPLEAEDLGKMAEPIEKKQVSRSRYMSTEERRAITKKKKQGKKHRRRIK